MLGPNIDQLIEIECILSKMREDAFFISSLWLETPFKSLKEIAANILPIQEWAQQTRIALQADRSNPITNGPPRCLNYETKES
jgi:hypothetical protein